MKKSFSKQQYLLLAGIIVAIVLTATLVLKTRNNQTTKPSNPIVKTILTQQTDKNTPIEVSGFVRGASRADVSPLASGTIVKILKHEGESVKKGEVLAIIRNDQIDAQVAAAKAGAAALEKTLSDSTKYYDH